MCVRESESVCMCVCERDTVCVRESDSVCVCVCECARKMCVSVCAYVTRAILS